MVCISFTHACVKLDWLGNEFYFFIEIIEYMSMGKSCIALQLVSSSQKMPITIIMNHRNIRLQYEGWSSLGKANGL